MIVTRRRINGDIVLADEAQLSFAFVEASEMISRYEYAVLITDLPYVIL